MILLEKKNDNYFIYFNKFLFFSEFLFFLFLIFSAMREKNSKSFVICLKTDSVAIVNIHKSIAVLEDIACISN